MKHSGNRGALFAICVTSALGVASAHGAGPTTFEPIGPEDHEVTGMSADGSVIVGTFSFGAPAFRWTREEGTVFIGGNGTETKVSSDGTVISGNVLVDGHNEAALWLGGEDWQPLGGLGDSGCPDFSNNYNISGNGLVIVGLGWDGCGAHGFRWEQSTGMVDLGNLGPGQYSRANATNFDGSIIVGWDDSLFDRRGARWVNGVESLLVDNSEPGLYLGTAEAVTPDGSIVVGGEAGIVGDEIYEQAYIWTKAEGGRLIGKLPGGGSFARAFGFAVTDDGGLVGGTSGGQFRDAFLWSESAGMVKFQDYLLALGVDGLDGWTLGNIRALSSDGTKAAGWAVNPNGRLQGWLVENLPALADSDADSVFDAVDNCTLEPNTDQRDTNGDGFGNICDPDLNDDLVVNFLDLGQMKSGFFTADEDADLDGDGSVNFVDLGIMKARFFGAPGPSGQVP